MSIVVVGVNHRTAPVEVREQLAFGQHQLPEAYEQLKSKAGIEGCALLSTCNRTEVYGVVSSGAADGIRSVKEFLAAKCGEPLADLDSFLYSYQDTEAIRHVFAVAAGLDSMILGETQILGQLRQAYQDACSRGATNGVLNTLLQQAITIGKKVRYETQIDQNAVSISYAAVDLARRFFAGQLGGRTVLVVGAGKMSQLTVQYLVANGVTTVLVSNRSYDRAVALAKEFGGRAVRFDAILENMALADIVISCTAASHHIIHPREVAEVQQRRGQRPLLFVDIAVPRDVEPAVAGLEGVTLYDIDDLQEVINHNLEERQALALQAEAIIQTEVEVFARWQSTLGVVPAIVALKEKGNLIKETELNRAYNRLGNLSPREKKIISSLANSIVNQLLHDPIVRLKESAAQGEEEAACYQRVFRELFNLGQGVDEAAEPRAVPEPQHAAAGQPWRQG